MSLYWMDYPLRHAVNGVVFPLFVGAGMRWATRPVPGTAASVEDQAMNAAVGDWVPLGALVVALVSALLLVRRYLFVKAVLTRGTTVTGTVGSLDTYTRTEDSESASGGSTTSYSYYVTLWYTWEGVVRKLRLKLPHSASTYQLKQGAETDLLVLDSAPNKPLIRAVYQEMPRIGKRRRKFFW